RPTFVSSRELSLPASLTIAELAAWYRDRGYHFIAVGEHSQDLNEPRVRELVDQSERASSADFRVIPGIEFACKGGLHILGIGVTTLFSHLDPVVVTDA